MVDKALLGAVAEIIKSERATTDEKIQAVAEEIRGLIPAVDPVQEDVDLVKKSLADMASEFASETAELITIINDKTKSAEDRAEALFEEVRKGVPDYSVIEQRTLDFAKTRIDEIAANVRDGRDGADGLNGKDGRDGIDRQLVEPVEIAEDARLGKGHVVYHRGGIYQAKRDCVGNPERDPHGYSVIVDGIAEIYQTFQPEEACYVLDVVKTTGERHEMRVPRMPSYLPPGEHKSVDGDFFMEGSTFNVFVKGEWLGVDLTGPVGAQGDVGGRGPKGRAGKDGVGIDTIELVGKTLHIVMTDGEAKEFLLDVALPEEQEVDQEIKRYAGTWHSSKSYDKGDVVTAHNGLFLALENTRENPSDSSSWVQMHGGGGGGGGLGGGSGGPRVFLGQVWQPPGTMDMNNHGIINVDPPRSGAIGQKDVTNKQYVDQAIAAGALYQGIYTVATNNPDLSGKTDSGFVPPSPGDIINEPPSNGFTPGAANVTTWHNWKGNGFDTFGTTTTVPTPLSIMLSDGRIFTHNIDPGTYADESALITALEAKFGESEIAHLYVYVNGADCWIGVETVGANPYCTAISNETGNAFPAAAIGGGNTVLNTYNWIVSTRDSNVPEALPPGIPGLAAGTVVKNSDVLQYSGTRMGFEVISGSSLTQSFSDQRYWQTHAGNMAWRDEAYNKGAVVYGTKYNAWFAATQNIPAGSPEPGDQAAAAMWRKINSTYGATVFFGKGDYDESNTTAANNWGLPAGTYPSGQQPLNGDSYYDVKTGTTVDFTITQKPPIFTISGSFDSLGGSNTGDAAGTIGNANMLDTWPQNAPPMTYGQGMYYPYFHNFTGGVFAGTNVASAFWIIYSGDPDADNGGYILYVPNDDGPMPFDWTINTPHPQSQADTITPNVVWGTRRNFVYKVPAGAADGDIFVALEGMSVSNYIAHLVILDKATDGANYEFTINSSASDATVMSPTTVDPHNSHITRVHAGWTAARGRFIAFEVKSSAAGKSYQISIESQSLDLSSVKTGTGKETSTQTSFKSDEKYPSNDFVNFVKAASGDAAATLPPGLNLGDNARNRTLGAGDGKVTKMSGYFSVTTQASTPGDDVPQIRFLRNNNPLPLAQVQNMYTQSIRGTDIHVSSNKADWFKGSPGFMYVTYGAIFYGRTGRFDMEIDRRNPNTDRVFLQTWYQSHDSLKNSYTWITFQTPKAYGPNEFYFTGYQSSNTVWEVYKG